MKHRIIDIHTHTFPEKIAHRAIDSLSHTSHTVPFTSGTPAGLLASQREAGIDLSVILPVATSPTQVVKVNDASHQLNEAYQGRLLSFACMHPAFKDYVGEMARIKDMGFKGIKIHPVYQGADLDGPQFMNIIKEAARHDLIVITHAGYDIGFPGVVHCSPLMARHVVEEIGPFKFVLAHMGGWRQWEEVPELLAGTGVYLDTSFSLGSFTPLDDGYWQEEETTMLSAEEAVKLMAAFGSDHVLFGSDSPWSSQKATVSFVQSLSLTVEEKHLIMGDNASHLLGL